MTSVSDGSVELLGGTRKAIVTEANLYELLRVQQEFKFRKRTTNSSFAKVVVVKKRKKNLGY